ncbi:SlyX protein [Nicoletella semolina]|uniref:Protein SlyX homolog n=1 Tax=Nicoletella semolina TaxID=271160 RepID=A0A4R2N6Z2_9PAST|nr:SlyX family protein [Nicoletella semolina]MDH2924693.1 SlyX protein [Nicoletella semolina]TCP16683.1 SlyX protein [Nicoletella semolina]
MQQNLELIQQYLVDLETRIAFQDHTIEELNQALVHQQFTVEKLQNQVRHLAEKLNGVAASQVATRAEEVPPPHY